MKDVRVGGADFREADHRLLDTSSARIHANGYLVESQSELRLEQVVGGQIFIAPR